MRILHVTPYFEHAWAYGGIPRVVSAQARGLAARGHSVTVCTTDACGPGTRLERVPVRRRWPGRECLHADRGLATPREPGHGARRASRDPHQAPSGAADRPSDHPEVVVCPNLSNFLAYRFQLYLPLGLRTYLRTHAREFDVAHLHACHHLPGTIAARWLRRAGVPYVLQPNGTAPRIEQRRLAKAVFDATAGRNLVRGASRLIAVTEAEGGQLARLGALACSIRVVPNPLDLSEFEPPLERGRFRFRHGLGAQTVLMYLGRISPRKRAGLIAEAAAAAAREGKVRLVFAGNDMGGGADLRRTVRRLGLESRAVFPGLLRGRERLEALADADVVLYPAVDEIFGLVPLEAILCGTPVIVADDSGCGEVIARTGGGAVVPGTRPAIAAALAQMLADLPRWRESAAEAAGRVRRWFSAETVCTELEGVYREVTGHRAEARCGD